MPKFSGKNLYVDINGTVISGDVAQAECPDEYDTAEVSGGGDSRKSYVVGMGDNQGSLEGPFNTSANRGHAVISALLGDETGATINIGPAGSAAGRPRYSGLAIIQSYNVTSPVTGAVRYRSGFRPINGTGMSWGTF